jgi:NAD(P)-dependent dehydrogenase (short-subunit alcohol dehydrogenase family)
MSMIGKVVLITGATGGVGLAVSKKLVSLGAKVVMIGRDPIRSVSAWQSVSEMSKGEAPLLLTSDFSSQENIATLSSSLHQHLDRIDVLINNAGGIFSERRLTEDGIERTLAINHIAPFYLTNLLLDLVYESREGRILTVASESHNGSLDFENLQGENNYNFFDAYNRSKLCNILFAYELSRRLKGSSVTSNCLSPGPTLTNFGNNLEGFPKLFPLIIKRIPFLFKTPEQSAENYVYTSSSPDLIGITGKFYLKCKTKKTKQITYDQKVAERLWSTTENLLKRPIHNSALRYN